MGRITKAKIDQIASLRKEGYTQGETADKVGVNLRTVRKYDPLRQQKKMEKISIGEIEEALTMLLAKGVVEEVEDGKYMITSLGKKAMRRFEELQEIAMLQYILDRGGPVKAKKLETFLENSSELLFQQAINEVTTMLE